MITKITLPTGYTAVFENENSPECPWTAWDGNPPILARSERSWNDYKTGLSPESLFDLIPDSAFEGEALDKTAETLGLVAAPGEIRRDAEVWGCSVRAVARGYFEPETGRGLLEDLAVLAGLTYYSGVSKGHSQGDWADVFLVATPAWLEETGVEPENAKAALEAAFKLWGHWAWGNVWYLSWLTRPDGSRVDPESCHGVYGDPEDEDSGGPDVAREESEADARGQALEAAEAASWAARDSITLPA